MKLLTFESRHLHPLVYIVDAPRVGSRGYKSFLMRLADMSVDITRVRLYNLEDRPFKKPGEILSLNIAVYQKHVKLLSFSKEADLYLMDSDIDEFFSLVMTQDKKSLKGHLDMAKEYVYRV